MCGIHFHLSRRNISLHDKQDDKFVAKALHKRRGPDFESELSIDVNGWQLQFHGHVLWTQGSKLVVQPVCDDQGNVLLWNGDLFNTNIVSDTECDSLTVLKQLGCDEDIVKCLTQLVGPFAFVYWNNRSKTLWFGRDVIGRASLLWCSSPDHVILSSVGKKQLTNLQELPAHGLYMINLENGISDLAVDFFPWNNSLSELQFDLEIPITTRASVSHVAISNGERDSLWFEKEPQSIDLQVYLNMYDDCRSPSDVFERLLADKEILGRVNKFIDVLSRSVEVRVRKTPNKCKDCTHSEEICGHSKVGVLFSGGLDSTVVALLADKYVNKEEAIDLYNVAFQNRTKCTREFNVPDRKTGAKSLEELQQLCPNRRWNFVKVDITEEELEEWRQEHISHLIHPLNTVLDDSLGCALWFAARGQGVLTDGQPYNSSARVVLLGMGADEMLGGYMRHRTQFRRERSWRLLAKSLARDLDIIGQRNLGRDNRIVADHGRQPRLPFLDERVVSFIQSLPPWQRCYLSDEMPAGVGDKLLLRLSAWRLGLAKASSYPKRALQFGSRIANSNEKGNTVSHRL